jgi:hypothetical protein
MGVCRYKMAHFKGYFLGARAVLDIFYVFAPVMESGRKNEGAILHLLMQFKRKLYDTLFAPIFCSGAENAFFYAVGKKFIFQHLYSKLY